MFIHLMGRNFRQCPPPIKRILLSGLIARIENKDRIQTRTFDYSNEKSGVEGNPIIVKDPIRRSLKAVALFTSA